MGGSLIVTIPRAIVEGEDLGENQLVQIEIHKWQKSGFGISRGLASFSKEDEWQGQLED